MFDPSQPPLVEETLLKKRRSLDDLILKRSTTVALQNKVRFLNQITQAISHLSFIWMAFHLEKARSAWRKCED